MASPFKHDILNGKVALVTGGGSGIGLEISTQLGKHGSAVAIMGRRRSVINAAADALRSQGVHAIGFEGDVRKQEDARRVLEGTVKHFGRLDILVNGAAGNFLASPEDLSPNGFKTEDCEGFCGFCCNLVYKVREKGNTDAVKANKDKARSSAKKGKEIEKSGSGLSGVEPESSEEEDYKKGKKRKRKEKI